MPSHDRPTPPSTPTCRWSWSEPARRARRRRPGPCPRARDARPRGRAMPPGRPSRVGTRPPVLTVVRAHRPGRRVAADRDRLDESRPGGVPHRPTTGSSTTSLPWPRLSRDPAGVEVRYGHRVVGVAARRPRPAGRRRPRRGAVQRPCRRPTGATSITAAAVIDASGTWGTPNPLGGDGYPAIGEAEHADRIRYGIPDLSLSRRRWRGTPASTSPSPAAAPRRRTPWSPWPASPSVIPAPGSPGWYAATTPTSAFGGGDNDQLEQRGALGTAPAAVADGPVTTVTGFRTARVEALPAGR